MMPIEKSRSDLYARYLSHLDQLSEQNLRYAEIEAVDYEKLSQNFIANEADVPAQEKQRFLTEATGWGPLTELLNDDGLTEIMINSYDSIWVERSGQVYEHRDTFFSKKSYHQFIQKLCGETKMKFDLNKPFCNGAWGSFRVHLVAPPLSEKGVTLTLRRHPENPWTLKTLMEQDWCPPEAGDLLRQMILEKRNFLVVGGTGTGKTSVLNACLQEVGPDRLVAIEDTSEIRLPHRNAVKLLTRTDHSDVLKDYHQDHLIKEALRMRPDRILVGEVRGAEAKDLLMALATGHAGSISTLHAQDARQALIRLEMLVQLGAPQWSLQAIRHLIKLSLDAILVLSREGGHRRLEQICKIASLEETGFCLETPYRRSSSYQN